MEERVPRPRRTSVVRNLHSIRRSLVSIARALARLAPALEGMARAPAPQKGRRKLKLSDERRASLKVQGQYMGHLRGLKPRQRAQVKALRAAKGVRAAIRAARNLARQGRARAS
jgi:hypothetical protein